MANIMMLSKNFDIKKVKYPCFMSIKYDGVPGIYTVEPNGEISVVSRQGKPITSTAHIKKCLKLFNFPVGTKIIGEHYIPNTKFNIISGKVRKDEPCLELKLGIFDILMNNEDKSYVDRMNEALSYMMEVSVLDKIAEITTHVIMIKHSLITDEEALQHYREHTLCKDIEGIMYRNGSGTYDYTRSWNCMKEVKEKTVDLQVTALIEALSKDKAPLGMIGTLVCKDALGTEYNVSVGKANHTTRKQWFKTPSTIVDKIVVVKYKPDESYKGLRQPTFQHIHEDKTEPDEVNNE